MKLKVKIIGSKVHDVGYQVFLLKHAMNLALSGLSTYNWEENGQQEVIALVEGDEARVNAFLQTVEKNKPEPADVSKVTYEDYEGDVGRTSEVAMLCSFVQLDKAIPLLLDMRDDLKAVRKNTDMIPQMSEDLRAVRKTTDETLGEIKGMRERHPAGICDAISAGAGGCPSDKGSAWNPLKLLKNDARRCSESKAEIFFSHMPETEMRPKESDVFFTGYIHCSALGSVCIPQIFGFGEKWDGDEIIRSQQRCYCI